MKKLFGILLVLTAFLSFSAFAQERSEYTLDAGDTVRVNVFGEENLSGDFQVGSEGSVAIPLIGAVKAQGLTLSQLEEAISEELQPDYLINPQVSIEVLNYRPFYILGEVNQPGNYPFVSGMTVIEAVAMAGGFTYRARTKEVYVQRAGGGDEEILISINDIIMPGDVIRVRERMF